MRFSWSRCLWLTDAWDWGNGLVRLMVWFALVHFCLTLGSCGHGLILVVLFRLVVVCWFHLIRELWSGGGLLIVPWFWRFGGVIHWLIIGQSGMSLIGEIVIVWWLWLLVLMGWWMVIGLGWVCLCYEWFYKWSRGGVIVIGLVVALCLDQRRVRVVCVAGLLVRVVCELWLGWWVGHGWWFLTWLCLWGRGVGFVALCPVVLEDVVCCGWVWWFKSRFSAGVHGWGVRVDLIVFGIVVYVNRVG